jgi:hypothetical protein
MTDEKNPSMWANFTIDAIEETGRIIVSSCYCNFQNYWGACGCCFKEFLTTLDMDYVAKNVGMKVYHEELDVYKIDKIFELFWDEFWIPFMEHLKTELQTQQVKIFPIK